MKEFERKGINSFIDNDIVRGKLIGPELKEAIRGSRIAIVLLSTNYASSTWCLDELVEIMKCRKELGQTVMTLFYEVDPSDVKKQTRNFGKVFRKTCEGKRKENIGRWREGLAEAATIAGEDSSNWDNEANMIEKIAIDVSKELINSTPSNDFDRLVGMESHMINMRSMLQLDLEEVRMIGIWGPSGIGKTTIARFLFDRHSKNLQLSIFIENIKSEYAKPVCSDHYGLTLNLQKKFMFQIINQMDIKTPHLGMAKDRLKNTKVLIVLDDVDLLVQLEAMANEMSLFGPSSRIIVTTQDQKLLKAHRINHIYKVDFPSSRKALEMFCMYAFRQKSPKDGFEKLARKVTKLVGEFPLGLSVMGSYFRGMSMQEWADALLSLKNRPHKDIESILKISYDTLRDDDKNLFRHIACSLEGESVDNVKDFLANSFMGVTERLRILAEKSLISIDLGIIKMHDLLVQLGREIVRKQNVDEPGKRQFLIDAKDIDEVLNDDNVDSRRVIGITSLNRQDVTLTSETAFRRLSNLQFLYIDGRYFNMDFLLDSISRKLRMLCWTHFHMPSFPSNFHTNFLVKLYMPHSKLEKLWEGTQPLSNLKEMDLSDSEELKELPDLSTATNLRELNLSACSRLVEIPSSIGNAINLQKLNLSGCSSLVKIPSSIWNATNLEQVYLTRCPSLVEIPSFIGNFHGLTKLDSKEYSKLEVFPTNTNLESPQEELDLSPRSFLVKSYETFLKNLEDVELINEVPPSSMICIGKVSCLRRLFLCEMKKLVTLPQLSYSLSYLDVSDCGSLERLDCIFPKPDILLKFDGCFKLNQEARDLIIHRRTNIYVLLPGGEVPKCFTYRYFGSSLSVTLNQPLGTSTKFKACILFDDNEDGGGRTYFAEVFCSITSKHNALTLCRSKRKIGKYCTNHLHIFEVEAEEVTSTELDFEFELQNSEDDKNWRIKECGIFQLEYVNLHILSS